MFTNKEVHVKLGKLISMFSFFYEKETYFEQIIAALCSDILLQFRKSWKHHLCHVFSHYYSR